MDLVEKVNNVDLSSILKEKVPLKDAYYELDISSINDDIKNCKLKDVELKLDNYSTALKYKLNKLCQRYLLDGEFKTSFKLLRNSVLSLPISYYPADGYRFASESSVNARDVTDNVFLHFIKALMSINVIMEIIWLVEKLKLRNQMVQALHIWQNIL